MSSTPKLDHNEPEQSLAYLCLGERMDRSIHAREVPFSERFTGQYVPSDTPHVLGRSGAGTAVCAGAAGRAGRGRVIVRTRRHS